MLSQAANAHASRLGVVVEVNCETDFVARGDKFRELVADLAMQIAASPGVSVVAVEDVSAEELDRERAIELQKEDILSKPEAIRCVLDVSLEPAAVGGRSARYPRRPGREEGIRTGCTRRGRTSGEQTRRQCAQQTRVMKEFEC